MGTAAVGTANDLRAFYARRKTAIWIAAVLAPFVLVAAGVYVAPEVFWDRFIWQDIYGPLWADAHQCGNTAQCNPPGPNPGGVTAREGYTITSELVYGVILAASLYGIFAGIFRRFHVKADGWFVAALIPYILLGPFGRTLEDADVFIGANGQPGVFAYLFISPVIYIHIAVYAVAFLLVGIAVNRAAGHVSNRVLVGLVAAIAAFMTAAYSFVGTSYASGFSAFAPGWVFALTAAAGVAFFAWRASRGNASVNATLFSLGLPLAVPSIYLVLLWVSGTVWSERAFNGQLHGLAGATIVALALTVVAIVASLGMLGKRYLKGAAAATAGAYAGGLNLVLVFGHMLDGFATWVALMDPFQFGLPRYAEKHPVSDMLLQLGAGTPFSGLGFPMAKLLMVGVVVWLLDREFEKENEADRQLVGLIKMAIFVLGFAPGLRDLLRISMGV